MPSKSAKQHNFFQAVAHNPSFAKKVGISQSVGRDFTEADKGRKFAKGGDMAKKLPPFMGKESKAEEAKEMKIKRMSPALYKKGEKAEGVHGKSGEEKPSKYAKGGVSVNKLKDGMWDTQKGWSVKGSASKSGLDAGNKSADGIARKGKTQGVNVSMGKTQKFAGGGGVGDIETDQNFAEASRNTPRGALSGVDVGRLMGRAGPNRMMSPLMTPSGDASLANAIKSLGGRQATPEEIAKMNSTMSSLGMSRPQFNPADADKLRAQMQSRLAAQGMRPPAARPVMGAAPGMKSGGSVKSFAKGGAIDGCATKGKTKGKFI